MSAITAGLMMATMSSVSMTTRVDTARAKVRGTIGDERCIRGLCIAGGKTVPRHYERLGSVEQEWKKQTHPSHKIQALRRSFEELS